VTPVDVRVLRGRPDDAEIAALVAALGLVAARAGAGRTRTGGWADRSAALGVMSRAGAWRRAARDIR
jgi:Acyl-CoA carboxylase epsilon subunit